MAVSYFPGLRTQQVHKSKNTMQFMPDCANDRNWWMSDDAGNRLTALENELKTTAQSINQRMDKFEKSMENAFKEITALVIRNATEDGEKRARKSIIKWLVAYGIKIAHIITVWIAIGVMTIFYFFDLDAPQWLLKMVTKG